MPTELDKLLAGISPAKEKEAEEETSLDKILADSVPVVEPITVDTPAEDEPAVPSESPFSTSILNQTIATEQEETGDALSRPSSALGSFMQGATSIFTSLPETLATARQARARQDATDIDTMLAGGEPSGNNPAMGAMFQNIQAMRQAEALGDEETASELRDLVMSYKDKALPSLQETPIDDNLRAGAKAVDEFMAEQFKTNPEFAGEFATDKLAQAFGSAASFGLATFMTRGALLKARVPGIIATPIAPAGLGVTTTFTSAFQEAQNAGLNFEDSYNTAKRQAPLGLSEAVPIARALDRWDAASGGTIKRALKDAMISGTENALQEVFQEVGGNAIKADDYDPEQGLWTNSGEAGVLGFTTGSVMSFLGSLVFGKRGSLRDKSEELSAADAGPQIDPSLLAARQEQMKIIEDQTEVREQLKSLASEEVTIEQNEIVPSEQLLLSQSSDIVDKFGMVKSVVEATTATDTAVQDTVLVTTDEDTILMRQAFEEDTGVIAVTESSLFSDNLFTASQILGAATVAQNVVPEMEAAVTYATNMMDTIEIAKKESVSQLKNWTKKQSPDMNIVVSFGEVSVAKQRAGIMDLMDSTTAGLMQKFKNVAVISVNPDAITNNRGELIPGLLQNVLAHEYGHALTNSTFDQQTPDVQVALLNGWKTWVNDLTVQDAKGEYSGFRTFIRKRKGFFRAEDLIQFYVGRTNNRVPAKLVQEGEPVFSPQSLSYQLSLAEYFADSMVFAKEKNTPTTAFFKAARDTVRAFYQENFGQKPGSPSFELYLQLLANNAAFDKVQETIRTLQETPTVEQSQEEIRKTLQNTLPPTEQKELNKNLDRYHLGMKYGYTLLQLAKVNPHIKGLQNYANITREWSSMKFLIEQSAEVRIHEWRSLPKKKQGKVGNFLLDLTVQSMDKGTRYLPGTPQFDKLVSKWGMTEDMLAVYQGVDIDMQRALDTLETALIKNTTTLFVGDQVALAENLKAIQREMLAMKNRNFFPLSRFGDLFVTVKATRDIEVEGILYAKGNTIAFMTAENKKDQKKIINKWSKEGFKISHGKLSDTQRQFAGFPPSFLSLLSEKLQLTNEQIAQMPFEEQQRAIEQQRGMQELLTDIIPGRSFANHLKNRKNVKGFSEDALRGYALYFQQFANHISRINFQGDMLNAIDKVRQTEAAVAATPEGSEKRTGIRQFLEDHYNYIMNPMEEFAGLRAFGFVWYLGFNPKSAIVNLTQTWAVTYPYLAARHGDIQATKALTKANIDATNYWLKPNRISGGQRAMIAELQRRQVLSSSMAVELAALNDGQLVKRLTGGAAHTTVRKFMEYSAFMFQTTEKMNRVVTALAAYNIGIKNGKSELESTQEASEAVDITQFEYAKWNRPAIMRGKKSSLFLFKQHLQHSLHFLFNDPGATRFAVMNLMIAGISGLAFMSFFLDIFDWFGKKYNKYFNKEVAPTNIRLDIRKFAAELNANPDLIMHGTGRYGFGLPALGRLMGMPLPDVDLSGSLSMGNGSALLRQTSGERALSETVTGLGGPVASIPLEMYRAITDNNPNTMRRFERALPIFLKNISKATRFAVEGEDTTTKGILIQSFDMDSLAGKFEIAAQATGFALQRVQEAKERNFMTQEITQYYTLRRKSLMDALEYSIRIQDNSMEKRAFDALDKYNATVPDREFVITGKQIRSLLKDRAKRQALGDIGITVPKSRIGFQEGIDEGFPNVSIGGGTIERTKQEQVVPEASALDDILKESELP